MAVGATRQWKGVGCYVTASGCTVVVVAGTGAGVGARATTGRERGIEQRGFPRNCSVTDTWDRQGGRVACVRGGGEWCGAGTRLGSG